LHPPEVRIAIVMDNFSPHLSTKKDRRVGEWAEANNVELAYVPTNASWLNRIEAQFQALRYFALDGTDHRTHDEQNAMIRRYIAWRNRHAKDKALHEVITRANVASRGTSCGPSSVLQIPTRGHGLKLKKESTNSGGFCSLKGAWARVVDDEDTSWI